MIIVQVRNGGFDAADRLVDALLEHDVTSAESGDHLVVECPEALERWVRDEEAGA